MSRSRSETPPGRGGRLRRRTEKKQESIDRQAEAAAKKAEKARKAQEKAEREKKGLKKAPSTKAKNAARQDANDDVPGAAGSITMSSINLLSKKTATTTSLASAQAGQPDAAVPPARKTVGVVPSKPPTDTASAKMQSSNQRPSTTPASKKIVTPPNKANGSRPMLPNESAHDGAATGPKQGPPPVPFTREVNKTTPMPSQSALSRAPLAVTKQVPVPVPPTRAVSKTAPAPLPPVSTTKVLKPTSTPGQARRSVPKTYSTPLKDRTASNSTAPGPSTPVPRLAPNRMAAPPIPPNRILGRTSSFEDAGPQPSLDDVKRLFSQTLTPREVEDAFKTFQTLIAVEAGGTGKDAVTAAFADSLTLTLFNSEGKKRARSASSATEVLDADDQPPRHKVEKLSTPLQEGQITLLKETATDIYRSKMFTQSFYPTKTEEWITATFDAACKELNVAGAILTSDLATQIHRTGSIYRSNLKDHGRHIATQAYGLRAGREERTASRVAALLANDTYIYAKEDMKRPPYERSLSYQHEGIALFIKRTWFNNQGSLGVRRGEHLTEIPKAAVAFACTMICFSIGQWSTGKFVSMSFNENEWKKVYSYHEARLTAFERSGRQAEMNGEENLYTKFAQDMLYEARVHAGVDVQINTFTAEVNAEEEWADEYDRRRNASLGSQCEPTSNGNNPLDSSDDEDETLEITGQTISNPEPLGDEDEASDFEVEDVTHERVPKRVKKKKKAVAALSDEGEASDDEQKSEGAESENYQQREVTEDVANEEGAGCQGTEPLHMNGEDYPTDGENGDHDQMDDAEYQVDGEGYQMEGEGYQVDGEGYEFSEEE